MFNVYFLIKLQANRTLFIASILFVYSKYDDVKEPLPHLLKENKWFTFNLSKFNYSILHVYFRNSSNKGIVVYY